MVDTEGWAQYDDREIASSADLVAWANRNLGWNKDEAVALLEERFGKLTSKRLDECAEWLYEQANGNGHKETEEAVEEDAQPSFSSLGQPLGLRIGGCLISVGKGCAFWGGVVSYWWLVVPPCS